MLDSASTAFREWCKEIVARWDQFLFAPADPATLGLIRILAGCMLFYTHAVWSLDMEGFFGERAYLSKDFVYRYHDSVFGWSHLYWIDNSTVLWLAHIAALGVFACLTIGYRTRLMSVLACLLTISYAHRASGALFGLDQINGFLALYLAVGPSGDAFSLDRQLKVRRQRRKDLEAGRTVNGGARGKPAPPSVMANIAIRLMQVHLCVVYLFAGLGKLLGESWWDGSALWGAFANQEYQTLDMTWLAHSIVLVNLLTHVSLFWEISYCFLIWNRITRPVWLLLAIPLHMGIALGMGMVTFGVIMLIANLSFVPPQLVRQAAGIFESKRKPSVPTRAPETAVSGPHAKKALRPSRQSARRRV